MKLSKLNRKSLRHLVMTLPILTLAIPIGVYIFTAHGVLLSSLSVPSNAPAGCGKAIGPFSVSGTKIMGAGQKEYVPYGFTLSGLQSADYASGSTVAKIDGQIDAAANSWCANTIRFQIEQDMLVGTNGLSFSSAYMNAIQADISYAEARGLVVVINDQTEVSSGSTANEPLPTSATVAFWSHMNNSYANDPQVIYDLFNEPRSESALESTDWSLWQNGGSYNGVNYIGMKSLARQVRSKGAQNLFWVEGIHYSNTLDGITTHQITNAGPVAYAIHHPTPSDPHNTSTWSKDFGYLVDQKIAPVVDGEWTNWASASNECWSDAPTAVPNYLSYLGSHDIGLTAWTLTVNVLNNTSGDYVDPTVIGSNWSCTNGLDQGAGQMLKNWFTQQNQTSGINQPTF